VVERGDEWRWRCGATWVDLTDEVDGSVGVCFSARKEASSGGGRREGLLWVDVNIAFGGLRDVLLCRLRAWIRIGEDRDVRMHDGRSKQERNKM
jgi:hypothetical protein